MGLDNPLHIAFLLVVLLLVFGAKRLPEMGRSLGSGLRGFKETIGGDSGHAAELSATVASPDPIASPAPAPVAAATAKAPPTAVAAEPNPGALRLSA